MPISQHPSGGTTRFYLDLGGDGGFCASADFPSASSLVIGVSTGLSRGFYNWISQSTGGVNDRRAGSIASVDYSGTIIYRDRFESASIASIQIPAMDASSQNILQMTVTLQVSSARQDTAATGQRISSIFNKIQRWIACDFRLTIDGVDSCKYLTKIDAFQIVPGSSGSELALTLKEQHAAALRTWFQSGKDKSGTLDVLSTNLSSVLFSLNFLGLTGSTINPAFPLNPTAQVTAKFRYRAVRFSAPNA